MYQFIVVYSYNRILHIYAKEQTSATSHKTALTSTEWKKLALWFRLYTICKIQEKESVMIEASFLLRGSSLGRRVGNVIKKR